MTAPPTAGRAGLEDRADGLGRVLEEAAHRDQDQAPEAEQQGLEVAWPPAVNSHASITAPPPCTISTENHYGNTQVGTRMTLPPGAEVAGVFIGKDPKLVVRDEKEDEHDVDQYQRRGHLPGPPHPARLGHRRRRLDEVDELVERQPAAGAPPLGDHPPDLTAGESVTEGWCSSLKVLNDSHDRIYI